MNHVSVPRAIRREKHQCRDREYQQFINRRRLAPKKVLVLDARMRFACSWARVDRKLALQTQLPWICRRRPQQAQTIGSGVPGQTRRTTLFGLPARNQTGGLPRLDKLQIVELGLSHRPDSCRGRVGSGNAGFLDGNHRSANPVSRPRRGHYS